MLTQTPICDFGKKAVPFKLKSTEGKIISLEDLKGKNGTLIMFICNHCPYVKAITKDIVEDCNELKKLGINSIAISSNDPTNYPEDSFENMIKFAKKNEFSFPYLIDETQEIAKAYDAVCTPDFFGYNKDLELLNNPIFIRVSSQISSKRSLSHPKLDPDPVVYLISGTTLI